MKPKRTLGIYWSFPNKCHSAAILEFITPVIDLQKSILNTLYKLNGHSVGRDLQKLIGPNVKIVFEFGVADGFVFNYIDGETLESLLDEMEREIFHILDILCLIRYYILKEGGKTKALRFDYYLIRFIFKSGEAEIQVFHERGLQRVSAEDLLKFLSERVGLEMAERSLGTIKIRRLWVK